MFPISDHVHVNNCLKCVMLYLIFVGLFITYVNVIQILRITKVLRFITQIFNETIFSWFSDGKAVRPTSNALDKYR